LLALPTHRANQYVTVGEHPRDLAKDAGSFSAPNVWSALAVLVGMYQGVGYRLISVANTLLGQNEAACWKLSLK
jgi:hypothetical protein